MYSSYQKALIFALTLALITLVQGCDQKKVSLMSEVDKIFDQKKSMLDTEKQRALNAANNMDEYQILLVPYEVSREADGRSIKTTYLVASGKGKGVEQARATLRLMSMSNSDQTISICSNEYSINMFTELDMYLKDSFLTLDKKFVSERVLSEQSCSTFNDCLKKENWSPGDNLIAAVCEESLYLSQNE